MSRQPEQPAARSAPKSSGVADRWRTLKSAVPRLSAGRLLTGLRAAARIARLDRLIDPERGLSRATVFLDWTIVTFGFSLLYVFYMQIATPMRVPWLFVAPALPASIALLLMRGRLHLCASMADAYAKGHVLSRLAWRVQMRTGSVLMLASLGLYCYTAGYMATHLSWMIAQAVASLAVTSAAFAMLPPPVERPAFHALVRRYRALASTRGFPALLATLRTIVARHG